MLLLLQGCMMYSRLVNLQGVAGAYSTLAAMADKPKRPSQAINDKCSVRNENLRIQMTS